MIASSSSEPSDIGTRKQKMIHQAQSLQILDGHPGIITVMELAIKMTMAITLTNDKYGNYNTVKTTTILLHY